MTKRGRKPKNETTNVDDKNLKAKQKVSELLDGIGIPASTGDKKNVETNKINELEKEKNNNWLEKEFDRLTEENEYLKSELAKVKNENNKLTNQKPVSQSTNHEINSKIKIMFKDIEKKLWARNNMIPTKYVLDLMLKNFMNILKSK